MEEFSGAVVCAPQTLAVYEERPARNRWAVGAIRVNRHTRLLLKDSGLDAINGLYVPRWSPAARPGGRPSPRWIKAQGGHPDCSITFAKRRAAKASAALAALDEREATPSTSGSAPEAVTGKPALWCVSLGATRVYQGRAPPAPRATTHGLAGELDIRKEGGGVGMFFMACEWEVAAGVKQPNVLPFPTVVDVTHYARLREEIGLFAASLAAVANMLNEESRGDALTQHVGDPGKVNSSSVGVMDAAGSGGLSSAAIALEDDDEDFKPGNWVILCPDIDLVRAEVEKAKMDWDDRLEDMLGESHEVSEVPDDKTLMLVCKAGSGLPILLPEIVVDMDYNNIAQFYSHHPIFIVTQTTLCFLLWFFYAVRDAGPAGKSFTAMLGGLDSIWPGQTSLLLSTDCEDFRPQIWRWLTYQFSHVGASHIGTNVAVNLLLGYQLERFHGTLKMAVMYEIGVLGGALCYLVSDAHKPVVGTSGGCFALIGIRVGDLMMNWNERPMRWARLAFLSGVIGLNMVLEMAHEQEEGASTSNAAHLGGGVCGIIAGIVVGRNLKKDIRETIFQIVVCATGVILAIFCLGRGLQWPPRNLFEDEPWCWKRQVSNMTVFGTWDWKCVRCYSKGCIANWAHSPRIFSVSEIQCHGLGGYAYEER